ncbi:MAG: hypothetical protein LUQ13_00170 [Methanomicrobiales archaeon]|nr:hypothetical protein [Methanomicrobiales archaeon]
MRGSGQRHDTTTLAFLFTNYETTQDAARRLVLASFAFAVPTLSFLLVLYFGMNHWSFPGNLCAAYLVRAGSVLVLVRAVPPRVRVALALPKQGRYYIEITVQEK